MKKIKGVPFYETPCMMVNRKWAYLCTVYTSILLHCRSFDRAGGVIDRYILPQTEL